MNRLARLIGLLAWVATTAFATPLPVTLIWQAPEQCPQHAEVWALLSNRLGGVPSTPNGASFAARGLVEETANGWKLSLQTLSQSGPGNREFTGKNCTDLTRLGVVALSVAIDPLLEPPKEVVQTGLWLGLSPKTAVGVLPFPLFGLAASAAITLKPASFGVSLETALSQRVERANGKALTLYLPFGVGIAACLGFYGERVSLLACANLHGAVVAAEPHGVDRPRAGLGGFLSVGPRGEFKVLIHSRVAIRLALDGSVALVRPSFIFADGADGYTASLFSGAGALGVEFKIW